MKILFSTLVILMSFSTYGQNETNWTYFVDLSKNGFIEDQSDDIHSKMWKSNSDLQKRDFKKHEPEVYRKSNSKAILIWSDTKDRITKLEYDQIYKLSINTFIVELNKKLGVIDTLDNLIIPIDFDRIISRDYKEAQYKLETQLFQCSKRTAEANASNIYNANSIYLISRKRDTILNNIIRDGDIKVDYFVNKKSIFTVLSFSHKMVNKVAIGKIWQKPDIIINDAWFYKTDEGEGAANFFTNPLVSTLQANDYFELYDFANNLKISSVPPFREIERISLNYATIKEAKFKPLDQIRSLISNEMKVIVSSDYKYAYIESLKSKLKEDYPNEYTPLFDRDLIEKQKQIDEDSLLLVSKDFATNNNNYDRLKGIYKIGNGEILAPQYLDIERINKKLCIIRNKVNNSMNILHLSTLKPILEKDYDNIVFYESQKDEKGYFFECTLDGKMEKKYLPDLENL